MQYPEPAIDPTVFTIYSKSHCIYCDKVKLIVQFHRLPYVIIPCDEYLAANKEGFMKFMKKISGVPVRTFPMVFHRGMFIGGFEDTQEYITNLELDFSVTF